ncbi:hypothetical protein DH2020_019953 [Rehmannia glutinosa]|uniref:Putative plant transposon protein domain-containing protein n=1 Tax=Rehmannia glutinosa TaxID=99300 RepID=A0ABR0WIC7_REHGL
MRPSPLCETADEETLLAWAERRTKSRQEQSQMNEGATSHIPSSPTDSEMEAEFAEGRAEPTYSGINAFKSYSRDFISEEASKNWDTILKQRVFQDKIIHMEEFETNNMIGYLKYRNIFKTVTYARAYVDRVIKEFYCNLLIDSFNPNSAKYGHIFLRKKVYQFTPQIANEFLETENVDEERFVVSDSVVVQKLTRNHVTKWHAPGKKLHSAQISSKYVALHKIAIANWLPTTNNANVTKEQAIFLYKVGLKHKINFGTHICGIISSYAERDGDNVAEPNSSSPVNDPILDYLIKQENYAASKIEFWIHQRDETRRLILYKKGE